MAWESYKVQGGQHKRILRDLCARTVGQDVSRLRKQGFAVVPPTQISPSDSWSSQWNRTIEDLWRGQWTANRRPAPDKATISGIAS